MPKRKILIAILVLFAFLCVVIGSILLMIGSVSSNMVMLYTSIVLLAIGLTFDAGFIIYILVYFIKKYR